MVKNLYIVFKKHRFHFGVHLYFTIADLNGLTLKNLFNFLQVYSDHLWNT